MKVSDKMFEEGKYPFSYNIYDGYAYLLNISNLSLGSVLTVIDKYLLTSCTKPWKLFIPTGLKVSVFRTHDFSVLIIGLNSALR